MIAPTEPSRASGRPDRLLAWTGEALLGAQLVVRHRGPRVALVVAGIVSVLVAAAAAWTPADAARALRHLSLAVALAAGVAAVAGARLLAPGPALHSARYASGSAGRAVAGRLLGAAGITGVPAIGLLVVLVPHELNAAAVLAALAAQWAALAVSAGVAPLLGVMPGGVLSVAAALAVLARPSLLISPTWVAGCAGVAVLAGGTARMVVQGLRR